MYSPRLPATPLCHAGGPVEASSSWTKSEFGDAFFLGKLLVETQTMTKLCGFGKGICTSHLKFTAGAPIPYQPVETLGWPCPAELCHTREQSTMQS